MISYNNSAPNAVNNVGQFGATEGSIGAYKSAAEYAADSKYWAMLSQKNHNSISEFLKEVERLYAEGSLLKEDIEQLKYDFENQNQTLLGLIQQTGEAIDNTNIAIGEANAATDQANQAVQDVLTQLDKISNMSVVATTLPPGAPATGSFDNSTGVFSFGIPEGQPGKDGKDGTDGTISDIMDVAVSSPVADDYGFFVDKDNGGLYRTSMSEIAKLVPAVASFNGRTGPVVPAAGDYTVSQVTGAAASGANSDITSLTGLTTALSFSQGGTGGNSKASARSNLEIDRIVQLAAQTRTYSGDGKTYFEVGSDAASSWGVYDSNNSTWKPLAVPQGGTGSSSAAGARANLGLGPLSTLSTVPIVNGGTGATTADAARISLVAAKSGANSDITSMANKVTFTQPPVVPDAVDDSDAVTLRQLRNSSDSDGILANKQAVARYFGVKQSEVVYFSVGVDLGGYKVIYDKEAQRAYSLPADIAPGTTAVSLSANAVLVHSAGSVDLGELAVSREEYVTLPGSFDTGATLNAKNELLTHTTGKYRWEGEFPKIVPAGTDPTLSGSGYIMHSSRFTGTSSISVMSFIPDQFKYVIKLGFNSAQSSGVDLLPYINKAQVAAKSLGAELTFPGGYFPVSDTVKQIDGCQVRGTPKKTFIIPTNSFPANKWLWVWPIRSGAPQKSLRDIGFQGASGHKDQSAKRVGGFAIKSGNWHSDVSGISIRNCFYGGVLINPQHPTSSGGTSDCVNLKLDHLWILDAGAIDYHQCFEIDIKNVDTDDTYAEDSSFAPPYSPGSWTDGAIRDMDLSACDTDPANPDTAGPYAMKLTGPSTVYTMFNVLVERIFTATRRQTHVYVDMPNLYNCTFSNFSGETHAGVSGVSADASGGNFNVFHVNLINAGSWNSFYDFYANASLGNNGLFVGNVDAATFHNMTIDVNYIGSELKDTGKFPRQITVSNAARNIAFENCNVRRLDRNDWFVTYKQYDIFTHVIQDDGVNTTFNSTQLKSVVPTFKPLNWFTSIGSDGLPVNGGSGTVGKATLVQGKNLTLNAILPAQAATEVDWYYDRSDFAPSYLKRIFVSLNIEVNSVDEAAGHFIKVDMFGQASTIQIPAAFVGKRIPILLNFTYNTDPALHKLIISLGSTGTASSDLNVSIRDFIVSPICYAYFPRYTSVISEYGVSPVLKGNNNFSGTNTFDSNNTYIGKNAANTGIGLHVGSTTTAGTSFIDMYSAGSSNAQARIATTGGNGTPYSGGLSFTAASLTMGASVIPNITNAKDLGSSSVTWRNIYSQNAVIVVSDENYKDEIQEIPDELLNAWADIKYSMWKMKSAINEKGRDNARYHFGIIAQHVRDVLASHGLDWEKYGLVTYEKWEAEEAEYAISPAEYAEDGTVVKEQSITEIKPRKEAGEIYMLRMEECMAVEAAYLRRKIEMLTQG